MRGPHLIYILLVFGGAQAATTKDTKVDLPSFLGSLTGLRNKLMNLLGNFNPSSDRADLEGD